MYSVHGTVGTVYRATDQLTDQSVAIKILLPQILDDSHIADRFHREMSILEKLGHPHIVHYLTGGDGRWSTLLRDGTGRRGLA